MDGGDADWRNGAERCCSSWRDGTVGAESRGSSASAAAGARAKTAVAACGTAEHKSAECESSARGPDSAPGWEHVATSANSAAPAKYRIESSAEFDERAAAIKLQ